MSIELGLGSSTLDGHHLLNVFHGKIISKALLGELLIGLWVTYAIYYVGCALHIAQRSKTRAVEQQCYLTQEIEELKVKATTDPKR